MPNPFSTPDDTIIRTKLPVFAPRRIISVAAYTEWVPDDPKQQEYRNWLYGTFGVIGGSFALWNSQQ